MSTSAHYQISVKNKVISARLTGDWHPAIDLMYMAELGDRIKSINNKQWALLVDMSECHIHANNIASAIADNLDTDRRNQSLEVWVVKHPEQGDFLMNFGSTKKAKIHKCFSTSEGHKHLHRNGFALPPEAASQFVLPSTSHSESVVQ